MSLIRCTTCGRRFATAARRCPDCGHTDFCEAPVHDEPASAEAITAVWAGVSDPPVHVVVAQLSDLAVLAKSADRLQIGDRLRLDDAPEGGFVARRDESTVPAP